jgi:hypothetical protein
MRFASSVTISAPRLALAVFKLFTTASVLSLAEAISSASVWSAAELTEPSVSLSTSSFANDYLFYCSSILNFKLLMASCLATLAATSVS